MLINDKRVIPYIDLIVKNLADKKDGHQRELIKILEKMELTIDQEGFLFECCLNIWKSTEKSPSTRIKSFQLLCQIATKHPELKREIIHYTSTEYFHNLGKGIGKTYIKLFRKTFTLSNSNNSKY